MGDENTSIRQARLVSPALLGGWLLLAGVVGFHYITSDVLTAHYFSIAFGVAAIVYCGARFSPLQSAGLAAFVSAIMLGDVLWFGAAPHEVAIEVGTLLALPLVLGLVRSAAMEVKAHPEGYYWDAAAEASMGRYITRVEASFLAETLTTIGQACCAVDAGAGSGRFTRMLAAGTERVIALETNTELTRLLSAVAPNVTPILVDPEATALPLRDASADCVVCVEVPDLAQHEWFWRECTRVLKPSGRLVLTLQNRRSWKGLMALINRGRYRAGFGAEYYAMSFRQLAQGLRRAGLEIEAAWGFNWIPLRRGSNSPLVRPLAKIEGLLGLRALPAVSPWVILSARRPES